MKNMFRSHRHRNPIMPDVQKKEQTPFFSKESAAPAQKTAFFQPKLTIGKADDPYEREADAVADKVVSRTNGQVPPSVQNKEISSVQRLATPEEDKMPATNDGRMAEDKKIQEKPIQRMSAPEEEPVQAKAEEEEPVQAKAEEEEPLQAKAEEEEPVQAKAEEEEPVQAKAEEEEPLQAKAEEEEPVQAKAENGGGVASQMVSQKIQSTKGRGEKMPTKTRHKMESAFGRDFSDVHIHTDSASVGLNQELHAQAFTNGKDIYFNAGKFSPDNRDGGHLLAHELTHVVQQKGDVVQRGKEEDEAAIVAAKAKLKADFHLKSVDDGDKAWTIDELTLAQKALAGLPAADKKAIENVQLLRTQSIGGVDSRTAGQFSSSQSVKATTVTDESVIKIGDIAFKEGKADESILTITHEVGHAVASLKERTATNVSHLAIADFNAKVEISNAANDLRDPGGVAFKAYLAKFAEYKAVEDEYGDFIDNKYNVAKTGTEQKAMKPEMARLQLEMKNKRAVYEALYADYQKLDQDYKAKKALTDKAEADSAAKKAKAEETKISPADLAQIAHTATTAEGILNTAAAKPVGGVPEVEKQEGAVYTKALDAASTDIKDFYNSTKGQTFDEKGVDALIKPVEKTITARAQAKEDLTKTNAKNGLLTLYAATEKAQDDLFKSAKAQALAHERKAIIQTFVEFVDKEHIPPTEANMTKYAVESWPHKPEEYYAEAYSFFVTKKLAAVNPKLNAWFAKGEYKPK